MDDTVLVCVSAAEDATASVIVALALVWLILQKETEREEWGKLKV